MEVSFVKVVLLHISVQIMFLLAYNYRNLVLKLGCYDKGAKQVFLYFSSTTIFLWLKAKIGFRPLELNSSFFFLPLLVVWLHHWLRKLIHGCLHLISCQPPAGKMPKNGHKREESYEGHLGFKSEVSPLFSPLEEEERKRKTSIKLCRTQSYRHAKRRKNERKKLLLRWWSLLKSPISVRKAVFRQTINRKRQKDIKCLGSWFPCCNYLVCMPHLILPE